LIVVILAIIGAFFKLVPDSAEVQPSFGQTELSGGSMTVVEPTDVTQVTLSAELVAPGFITVHESMGGAPGETIAVSGYLEALSYGQITLFTDTAMTPGLDYIALLHVDDNDRVFDLENDQVVTVNGEVVRVDFVIPDSE